MKQLRSGILNFVLVVLVCGSALAVELQTLAPIFSMQGWGNLQINKSVQGKQLQIGGRTFRHRLGAHAHSEIAYDLGGQCRSTEIISLVVEVTAS